MNIDFDYLKTVPKEHPHASSVRWGCSFDGRQLALVGYILEPNGRFLPRKKRFTELIPEQDAIVFFATVVPGCTITRAVKVLDSIADALTMNGLTVYVEGALGRNEVFLRHLKKHTRHEAKLFRESSGKWFQQVEVIAAVADDKSEDRIKMSPVFEPRPERVLLDEAIGVIEEEKKMAPLQDAFVYGLGYWSCKENRQKFQLGRGPAFW